ncbi:MAG: SDR family oxidoreductase [Alphaproteobacteria bacterium]|nr:SDR family oxidoreductase [Alphaproteobacteria bacterium]
MRFDRRIVAVTGAASGFGRAIARGFAGLGARVFGCDIAREGLAEIASLPGIATAAVDLSDRAAAGRWIGEVEAAAGKAIDVLVNNAGGTLGKPFNPIEDVRDADWDYLFAVNVHAAMATIRAAARAMKAAKSGAIVNISSGAGLKPSLTGIQAYCASKHALVGLTRQLAEELGPFGIRVNSVAPGLVLNDAAKQRRWDGYSEEKRSARMSQIALRRLGSNEDIADGVLFLASDMARQITGQVLPVDGGA